MVPLTCAVRGDLKLVRRGEDEILFDLASDPEEQKPVRASAVEAEHRDQLTSLRAALDFGNRPVVDSDEVRGGGQPSEDEIRQLEERMKLLGYM